MTEEQIKVLVQTGVIGKSGKDIPYQEGMIVSYRTLQDNSAFITVNESYSEGKDILGDWRNCPQGYRRGYCITKGEWLAGFYNIYYIPNPTALPKGINKKPKTRLKFL